MISKLNPVYNWSSPCHVTEYIHRFCIRRWTSWGDRGIILPTTLGKAKRQLLVLICISFLTTGLFFPLVYYSFSYFEWVLNIFIYLFLTLFWQIFFLLVNSVLSLTICTFNFFMEDKHILYLNKHKGDSSIFQQYKVGQSNKTVRQLVLSIH